MSIQTVGGGKQSESYWNGGFRDREIDFKKI